MGILKESYGNPKNSSGFLMGVLKDSYVNPMKPLKKHETDRSLFETPDAPLKPLSRTR